MMKKVNFFFYRKGKIRQFDVKPQIVAKAKEKSQGLEYMERRVIKRVERPFCGSSILIKL